MIRKTLRFQILRLFVSLILVSSIASITAVYVATDNNINRRAQENLELGERLFDQLKRNREQTLYEASQLLTTDFGFRQAVASQDEMTIVSAMQNHGARINADIMMMLDLDGELIATTQDIDGVSTRFDMLLGRAEQEGGTFTVEAVGDSLYQLLVVPVKAPLIIAWAAVGFEIDKAFLESLKDLSNLELTVWLDDPNSDHLYLSTFAEALAFDSGQLRWSRTAQSDYLNRRVSFGSGSQYDAWAYLSYPIQKESERFTPLRVQLLLIAIIVLVVSITAVFYIARKLSKPLISLVQVTEEMGEGHYDTETIESAESTVEIRQLAESLRSMGDEIGKREDAIKYQLYHDHLTHLPNRTFFQHSVSQRIASSKGNPFYVALLNINKFKQVNETFGMHVGDDLLIQVAKRLNQLVDGNRGARLGADEFALLITEKDVMRKLIAMKTALEAPYQMEETELAFTVRFGFSSYPDDGDQASKLLRRADIALNRSGEDASYIRAYQEGDDDKHIRHITLINDLRKAVQQNALSLAFQPKWSSGTSSVKRAEALLRWEHETMGWISPAEFIPLAEQAGLIKDVTHWVVNLAIDTMARWRKRGIDLSLAVNLSAYDLVDISMPEAIQSKLSNAGLLTRDLRLEITESAVMQDVTSSLNVLNKFKELGFPLSIDDYGTGYSSLAQLKRLPVDELKIDMSFVRQLDQDTEDQVIVKSTIDLAHSIGLTVCAEGVETGEALKMLNAWGCERAQGYYIARPLSEEALIETYQQLDERLIDV